MSACVRWRCMEWRNEYGACIDPAQCAGLVADRTGRRPGTPSAAPAAVGGRGMDRVCVMAGPDTAHALALSRIADADRGPGGGHSGRIRCPGNADRAGRGSDAAVVAVHAQTAGDAQTPGRIGGHLPGFFHRRNGVPVQSGHSAGGISVLLAADTGGGSGWPAADPEP